MIAVNADSQGVREFLEWVEATHQEVAHVQKLLSEKLSDNPRQLVLDLTEIEAWLGRMTTLLADATAHLDRAEQAALDIRGESWTDLDRKTNLKANTSAERRIRDTIDGLVEAIRMRLMLGMSLNKSNVSEKIQSQMQRQ